MVWRFLYVLSYYRRKHTFIESLEVYQFLKKTNKIVLERYWSIVILPCREVAVTVGKSSML